MAQFGTLAGCDSGVGVCVCSHCSGCCHDCGSFQNRGSAGTGASSRHFPRERREGNLLGSCLWCRHVGPAGLGDPGCRRAAMEGPERPSLPAPRPRSQADASGLRPGAVPRAKSTREEAAGSAAPPSEPAPEGASPCEACPPTPPAPARCPGVCPGLPPPPGTALALAPPWGCWHSPAAAGIPAASSALPTVSLGIRENASVISASTLNSVSSVTFLYFYSQTQASALGEKQFSLNQDCWLQTGFLPISHPFSPPVGACGETQNALGRAQLCRVCSRGGCSGQAGSSGSSSSDISPL